MVICLYLRFYFLLHSHSPVEKSFNKASPSSPARRCPCHQRHRTTSGAVSALLTWQFNGATPTSNCATLPGARPPEVNALRRTRPRHGATREGTAAPEGST